MYGVGTGPDRQQTMENTTILYGPGSFAQTKSNETLPSKYKCIDVHFREYSTFFFFFFFEIFDCISEHTVNIEIFAQYTFRAFRAGL